MQEKHEKIRLREVLVALGLILVMVLWVAVLQWTEPERTATTASKRMFASARVLEVLEDDAEAQDWTEGRRIGKQALFVELTSGPWKGETCTVMNYMTAYTNVDAKAGTRIIVRLETDEDGQVQAAAVPNYLRSPVLLGLAALFAALLIGIGRKKGLMALLGLIYTLAAIWFVLIPMLRRGADPMLVTIAVVALTTAASLFLLTGWSRKTLCATLGCIGGVAAAGLLAALAGTVSPLNGFNLPEAEELVLRSLDGKLRISGLFVSGILIASLGAVMDVAMSISSACWELRTLDPSITRQRLFRSGMNIGRDAMGTMANTLILAFAGSSLNVLLLFRIYDYPLIQLFNADTIAIEAVRGLAGSIGILLCVPLVAFLSAELMAQPQKTGKAAKK